MAYSEAQKRAVKKYNAAHYDKISLRVKAGEKAKLAAYAEARGESLNAIIVKAIEAMIENECE